MVRMFLVALAVIAFSFSTSAWAQTPQRDEVSRVEVGAVPAGGLVFARGREAAEPGFDGYVLAASLTFNASRLLAVEYEVGAGFGGGRQNLVRRAIARAGSGPAVFAFNLNVVVSPLGNDRSVIPYFTGGLGSLSVFARRTDAFADDKTYLTFNVGGGVKRFFGRWGLRGDYRLLTVAGEKGAQPFFAGRSRRYGHRISGGVIVSFYWFDKSAP